MDFFEQFMYEELESLYADDSLKAYEYEDIYERFTHLDYLEEVKPYIYAMRFLGKGTVAQPELVLQEIEKENMDNPLIKGLYFDIKLILKKDNANDIKVLKECVSAGYSEKFLRDNSFLASKKDAEEIQDDEKVIFKSMIFEGCGYSGFYFTSGDIDFLHAKVFIEPIKKMRHFSVKSQIYAGDEPFSEVFSSEYTLKPGDTWFTTQGWGNKNFNCYGNRVYRWIVEFDGDKNNTYSQNFRFYSGKIQKSGVPVKDIKLFASKKSGALEADRDNYALSFDKSTLECIYFKMFIEEPGQDTMIQIFLKITCLEDNSVFYDKYILHHLNARTYTCWNGVGFNQKGKWKAGLYKYSIHVGTGPVHEGIFTVY